MAQKDINVIWPEELKNYFQAHREDEYLLVDVRQPEEYAAEHLPGANLMVLNTLENKLDQLPKDKDLIFY